MRRIIQQVVPMLICATCIVAFVLLWCQWWATHIGPSYDCARESDVSRLRDIATSSRPFRAALQRYRGDSNRYPALLTELYPRYLLPAPASNAPQELFWRHWGYSRRTPNSFSIFYKLNWDASLIYEYSAPNTQRWYYEPGDGGQATNLTGAFRSGGADR